MFSIKPEPIILIAIGRVRNEITERATRNSIFFRGVVINIPTNKMLILESFYQARIITYFP